MRQITWLIALVLAAGVLTAAGCGGDDSGGGSSGGTGTSNATSTPTSSGGGGAQTLTVTADPGGAIKWDKNSLSAKAGKVTLKIVNDSAVPHAIEVEGNGVEEETKIVTKGNADVTVDLKPGKYEFYCPVDEHKQQGMKGTLTVS
jgi:plastocyanin